MLSWLLISKKYDREKPSANVSLVGSKLKYGDLYNNNFFEKKIVFELEFFFYFKSGWVIIIFTIVYTHLLYHPLN